MVPYVHPTGAGALVKQPRHLKVISDDERPFIVYGNGQKKPKEAADAPDAS